MDWKLGLTGWLVVGGAIAVGCDRAFAQSNIVPDKSLGAESSVVTPNVDIKGIGSDRIDGGAIRGANLFHSFGEFNINSGRGAYFTNPAGIENIFSRVTGGNRSSIFGKLGVLGNANLFLINPSGIIFGRNASLDVKGSFVASTASSLNFADGVKFSATTPETTPLLTVSVPLGLQFGKNPGKIQVQGDGQGIRSTDELIDTTSGLRVQPNQTLALVGGDVSLDSATLKTAGGRIELGSVGDNSLVSLTPINKGFSLGYGAVQNFGNIQLSQQAAVDASGAGGGDIQFWGRRVTLTNGSQIEASTLGAERGGAMVVNATESVEVIGISSNAQFPSGLFADAYGGTTGTAGDLTINTRQLLVRDEAQVNARTFGAGKGGNLTVNATDKVQVIGESPDGQFVSKLSAQSEPNATGDAGDLTINTRQLLVQDGAQVIASTFGAGKGGNLTVNATDSVQVIGRPADGQFPGVLARSEPNATGDAGDLTINTRELLVRDGARVSTNTFGKGNGGNLIVNADRLIVRDGSQVSAGTFGKGNGGNLIVNATDRAQLSGFITLRNGRTVVSGLFVSTQAVGNAGTQSTVPSSITN